MHEFLKCTCKGTDVFPINYKRCWGISCWHIDYSLKDSKASLPQSFYESSQKTYFNVVSYLCICMYIITVLQFTVCVSNCGDCVFCWFYRYATCRRWNTRNKRNQCGKSDCRTTTKNACKCLKSISRSLCNCLSYFDKIFHNCIATSPFSSILDGHQVPTMQNLFCSAVTGLCKLFPLFF